MRLTIPRFLQDGKPVNVSLHLPSDSINGYMKQEPLELTARLCWQRKEDDRLRCGLEFASLNPQQRRGIERIFEFYQMNPEYASTDA